MTDPITAVIGPHQSHTSLIVCGKRSPVRSLPPRLVPKPDAFALGPAGTGDEKTSSQGDVLTAAREGTRERETKTPSFRIGLADVVPLSGGGVLFGKAVKYDLAGGV